MFSRMGKEELSVAMRLWMEVGVAVKGSKGGNGNGISMTIKQEMWKSKEQKECLIFFPCGDPNSCSVHVHSQQEGILLWFPC